MPSIYQQDSLQAMLGLFLEGQGIPLPEHLNSLGSLVVSRPQKWPFPIVWQISPESRLCVLSGAEKSRKACWS